MSQPSFSATISTKERSSNVSEQSFTKSKVDFYSSLLMNTVSPHFQKRSPMFEPGTGSMREHREQGRQISSITVMEDGTHQYTPWEGKFKEKEARYTEKYRRLNAIRRSHGLGEEMSSNQRLQELKIYRNRSKANASESIYPGPPRERGDKYKERVLDAVTQVLDMPPEHADRAEVIEKIKKDSAKTRHWYRKDEELLRQTSRSEPGEERG